MSRNILYPALFAFLLATGANAAMDGMIKEIEVQVDLTAVTNPAAAARYANLGADLQGALAARLVDRIAEDSMRVSVDLSEVELSNSFQEAVGLADAKLAGTVKISDLKDNTHFDTYELVVTIDQALPFFAEGVYTVALTASSDDYYKAMVAAFADAVVLRLQK